MKKGFTLVELSIVLVIIGLLIGGILAAQSIISTAKDQKLLREMNGYLIAARNFKTSYNRWPGDNNNDGIISIMCSGCTEGINFFTTLSSYGLIPAKLQTGTDERYFSIGVNVPKGPDQSSIFFVDSVAQVNGSDATVHDFNVAYFSTSDQVPIGSSFLFYAYNGSGIVGGPVDQSAGWIITPQSAYNIDLKTDDGMPNTGNTIGTRAYQVGGDVWSSCTDAPNIYGTTQYQASKTYNLNTKEKHCALGIKLAD